MGRGTAPVLAPQCAQLDALFVHRAPPMPGESALSEAGTGSPGDRPRHVRAPSGPTGRCGVGGASTIPKTSIRTPSRRRWAPRPIGHISRAEGVTTAGSRPMAPSGAGGSCPGQILRVRPRSRISASPGSVLRWPTTSTAPSPWTTRFGVGAATAWASWETAPPKTATRLVRSPYPGRDGGFRRQLGRGGIGPTAGSCQAPERWSR